MHINIVGNETCVRLDNSSYDICSSKYNFTIGVIPMEVINSNVAFDLLHLGLW